jgi:hypothetical protein
MVNVVNTTRPRVPLRILLRVAPAAVPDLAARLAAYKVVILGEAKREYWNALWREGDMEAFAWVATSDVNLAIDGLRGVREVVEARISMRDVK